MADWLNLNGTVFIWEGRNNVFETNDLQHNRAYGFGAVIQPTEKLGFEVGYDYNDVYSQVLICYISVANDFDLLDYHDQTLQLGPGGAWAVLEREQAVSA